MLADLFERVIEILVVFVDMGMRVDQHDTYLPC
jgi:hypothetical protein